MPGVDNFSKGEKGFIFLFFFFSRREKGVTQQSRKVVEVGKDRGREIPFPPIKCGREREEGGRDFRLPFSMFPTPTVSPFFFFFCRISPSFFARLGHYIRGSRVRCVVLWKFHFRKTKGGRGGWGRVGVSFSVEDASSHQVRLKF